MKLTTTSHQICSTPHHPRSPQPHGGLLRIAVSKWQSWAQGPGRSQRERELLALLESCHLKTSDVLSNLLRQSHHRGERSFWKMWARHRLLVFERKRKHSKHSSKESTLKPSYKGTSFGPSAASIGDFLLSRICTIHARSIKRSLRLGPSL